MRCVIAMYMFVGKSGKKPCKSQKVAYHLGKCWQPLLGLSICNTRRSIILLENKYYALCAFVACPFVDETGGFTDVHIRIM